MGPEVKGEAAEREMNPGVEELKRRLAAILRLKSDQLVVSRPECEHWSIRKWEARLLDEGGILLEICSEGACWSVVCSASVRLDRSDEDPQQARPQWCVGDPALWVAVLGALAGCREQLCVIDRSAETRRRVIDGLLAGWKEDT